MKQLELELKKRLLIVEYESEEELKIESALMKAFGNSSITNHGHKVKTICKGSELTEENPDLLVESRLIQDCEIFWDYKNDRWFDQSMTSLDSSISAIEAQGYYWSENPLGKAPQITDDKYKSEREFIDNNPEESVFGDHYADWSMWSEAESKTFNPEKTLIFEIL